MNTPPEPLAAHVASGTTTLADLLKITRKDGEVFAFTSALDDVTISGVLYKSAQGLNITTIEASAGLNVDNLELSTLDDGTVFNRLDVLSGRWRNADFVISRYNWASPTDGLWVRMVGTLGEVRMHRGYITAELRGLQQFLQQPIGSVSSKTCRARLGDSLCGVSLAGYTTSGTVNLFTNNQSFSDLTISGDAHYSSVIALFNFNGTNGSTTFLDQSPLAKTYTLVGTPTISTAQSKFGGSAFFTSTIVNNSYIKCLSPDLVLPGDLTAECFAYVSIVQISYIFTIGITTDPYNEVYVGISPAGRFGLFIGATLIEGPSVTTASWHHLAITREAGVWRLFVNGTPYGNHFDAMSLNDGQITIGARDASGFSFGGYVDSFRVTKDVVRYSPAGFTPTVLEFLPNAAMYGDDYFAEGLLTWTSGPNSGLTVKVKSFLAGVFTLSLPMVSAVAEGHAFSVIAGCQKRLTDCAAKFNNVLNFQGEPHLPGVDKVLK